MGHAKNVVAGDVASGAEQLGTGLADFVVGDAGALGRTVTHPLISPAKFKEMYAHPERSVPGTAETPLVTSVGKSTIQSTVKSVSDPSYMAAHPAQTALTIASLASLGAGTVARTAYAAKALSAASDASRVAEAAGAADLRGAAAADEASTLRVNAAKALTGVGKPPTAVRVIEVPKTVRSVGPVTKEGKIPTVVRTTAVQLHESASPLPRVIQKAHDLIVQKALDGTVGEKTSTSLLQKYALKRVGSTLDETGRTTAALRNADVQALSNAGRKFDQGVSKPAGQLALFLRSANVTAKEASDYWAGQAAKGVNPKATRFLSDLAKQVDEQGLLRTNAGGNVEVAADQYPRLGNAESLLTNAQSARENVIAQHGLMDEQALQTRKNLIAETMGSEQARSDVTGVRTGQGFVSLATSKAKGATSPVARAAGSIIPLTKRLRLGKEATGTGVMQGLVPANTTQTVAQSLRDAYRFQNSDELRAATARYGSVTRNTTDDVLIRDPAQAGSATVPEHIKQLLGKSESTLSDADTDTLRKAWEGVRDDTIRESPEAVGTAAPAGWKWVNKNLLPGTLRSTTEARGPLEKFAGKVNSAVTSATIYFRLGHLPTRLLTNLSTNAVQGSLSPGELGRSVTMARSLSEKAKADLVALTGHGGYGILPQEGEGFIGKAARVGSGAYAKKIDAPFRLNAILYEFRQIGIDSPEAIERTVAKLKDPQRSGMSGAQIMKVESAVRRSNRASIMYDGLSQAEKRNVARYVWFYPWTKGAVRFTGHTIAEHPGKTLAGVQIGNVGRETTQGKLGPTPSYEDNLTAIGGGAFPLTTDLSKFLPYGTTGDVAQVIAHPLNQDSGVFGQLNPVYQGLVALVRGDGVKKAAGEVLSPTPEYQGVTAAANPAGSGSFPTSQQRLFGETWQSQLARAFLGTAFPRKVNKSKLATDAAREHEKKRTITIYGG